MTHHSDLAQHLDDDAEALVERRKSLERLSGLRARQALGELDGAIAAIRRAKAFLLAGASTAAMPVVKVSGR